MNSVKVLFVISCILLYVNCSTEDAKPLEEEETVAEITLATVSTLQVLNLDAYDAVISGKIENTGGGTITERGICYATHTNPDLSDFVAIPKTIKGSGEFEVDLTDLSNNTNYYSRAFAKNAAGVSYGNELTFKTLNADVPKFEFNPVKVSGVHDIWIETNIIEQGDASIEEVGVVYGISSDLHIDQDEKVTQNEVNTTYLSRLPNLDEDNYYHIKAYAITENGDVFYSEPEIYKTIKSGDFTYTINGYDANNPVFIRLKNAIDKVQYYYNNFTSIKKHVWVNYVPGVGTADANFEGWIRFGSNESYQRTGTALHEVAHTVGVGTHWKWNDLLKDGVYQGTRANEILQLLTQNKDLVVKGDGLHFWPYGINGAHEDDGQELSYIINTLIIQGMRADGLPIN